MLNKKMLLSVLIIGVVAVSAGSGTWAYFQDKEKSQANTLAAGTLDLTLTDSKMSISNTYPGASGTNTKNIKNSGSLPGELDIVFSAIGINNVALPEGVDAGTSTLDSTVEARVWLDMDKDGTLETGELMIQDYSAISTYDNKKFDAVTTMPSGADYNLVIDWRVSTGADNGIQGDSLTFDVEFTLEQAEADPVPTTP